MTHYKSQKAIVKSLNFVENTLLNLEPYDFIDIGVERQDFPWQKTMHSKELLVMK